MLIFPLCTRNASLLESPTMSALRLAARASLVAVDRACLAAGAAQRAEVGHAAGDPAERVRGMGYARVPGRAPRGGNGLCQVRAADGLPGGVIPKPRLTP